MPLRAALTANTVNTVNTGVLFWGADEQESLQRFCFARAPRTAASKPSGYNETHQSCQTGQTGQTGQTKASRPRRQQTTVAIKLPGSTQR